MKKTRLAAAIVAVSLSLVGCIGDDKEEQAVTESYVGFDPVVPATENRSAVIPFPFDALFAGAKTPTLNIPNAKNSNLVVNANMQDGFSTTASWFIDIFGFVDMTTVPANLLILNTKTNMPLVYGTDFTIESSTVKDTIGVPINAQRTRLLIEPLKPLTPNATYVVLLKKGVKTLNGGTVQPSYMFNFLNSDVPIASRTDSYFKNFSATEKATLEALRSQLVRKIVNNLKVIPAFGVTDSNVLLAYSVTTQSTTKTMDKLATIIKDGAPNPINAVPIGQTVADILTLYGQKVLPPNSDQTNVYVGTLTVPYYGDVPSATKPTAILSSYWKADAAQPDLIAKVTPFNIPCGAYAKGETVNGIKLEPSISTTTCFPMPVKQSDQVLPIIVTVPKTKPVSGNWPVVIFQHGITRNRTDIFAVASTYAKAGFVTVALDLPLHGLAAKMDVKQSDGTIKQEDNLFYKNQILEKVILATGNTTLRALETEKERTFDVDFLTVDANGNVVASAPDGKADNSGSHFINLSNPISSRDNLRQGASDILILAKSLSGLQLNGLGVDTNKIYLSSISLGTIVGTVALGADKEANLIKAASISVGGGAIAKLLDASKGYGKIISDNLAIAGVSENTDDYETFMRFAQTLVDSGDPINFAMNAKMNRPIHFTQVLNDLVVPNAAVKGAASATQDFVGATGFLSGNNALARTMGFTARKDLDMATLNKENVSGSTWLQFNQGTHGSLINPAAPTGDAATDAEKAAFLAITTEMQCQTVSFFATLGAIVPVGCSKPAEVK